MLHKGLFLILVLALSFVPVFQTAHALTHVAPGDTSGYAQADGDQGERDADTDTDTDTDTDRVCLDCLALTAFSIIPPILAFFFFGQIGRQLLQHSKSRRILLNFSSAYLTRAPPRA
ncbi:MAG: hypothetical protein KGM95_05930 [Betaproteobacteria bacterium]|nr:hypothetical protein [Betaproteobacteria bacterium]